MPLTRAAQRVQISAYPDAYAKHEHVASQIVNALAGGAARGGRQIDGKRSATAAAAGRSPPPAGPRRSTAESAPGSAPPSRPSHNGVDIGAPQAHRDPRRGHRRVLVATLRRGPAAAAQDCDVRRLAWQGRLRLVRRHPARRRHTSPGTAT